MNIEQLKFIAAVARYGTLTAAAGHLHMTVAGISRSISQLETELGVRIFSRSRSGALPTREGEMIIAKALSILSQIQELKTEANLYQQLHNAKLKIATIPGPISLLVSVLTGLKKEFPELRLEITEKGTNEILEDVRQNRMDIGFVLLPDLKQVPEGLSVERLKEDKVVIGMSRQSPLASSRQLTVEDLKGQRLALYPDDYISQIVAELGDAVEVLFTSNNIDAIVRALLENWAVTVATHYSVRGNRYFEQGEMVAIPLQRPGRDRFYLCAVQSKDQAESRISKMFVNRLKMNL
jgi:DNA-binding transcriptional LysR family regulator